MRASEASLADVEVFNAQGQPLPAALLSPDILAEEFTEWVEGSYLHGLFAEDAFRTAWLAGIGAAAGGVAYGAAVEAVLDRLAAHLEAHLDVDALLATAR